jgi:hypothetical protein
MPLCTDVRDLIIECNKYASDGNKLNIFSNHDNDIIIKFDRADKGIKWKIRENVWNEGLQISANYVYVTINPKILARNCDYITAANLDDMNVAIVNFDELSKSMSHHLGKFYDYQLNRIDYCVNFSLQELTPGCTPEQIMKLIKRSSIPHSYKEWKKYNSVSHRKESLPGSFYLTNRSAHINCYSKYMKFIDQNGKNIERGYPPIPQETLDAAYDIIRFEVQCKYSKTHSLSRNAWQNGSHELNQYKALLNQKFCTEIIGDYYTKTVGCGDWYTLQAATEIIESHKFNGQKEKRLIDTICYINQCRSVEKAKEAYDNNDLVGFKKTLKEISNLGINPVTIPKEWGVQHIPNLLSAYKQKSMDELRNKYAELLEEGK